MQIVALDIGEKRIGVAVADSHVRIALPRPMIPAGDDTQVTIAQLLQRENAKILVYGLPRNNSGETTRQTEFVETFILELQDYLTAQNLEVVFVPQDESWTSEQAKDRLTSQNHIISRQERDAGLIDSEAAAVILQDFLESPRRIEIEANIK